MSPPGWKRLKSATQLWLRRSASLALRRFASTAWTSRKVLVPPWALALVAGRTLLPVIGLESPLSAPSGVHWRKLPGPRVSKYDCKPEDRFGDACSRWYRSDSRLHMLPRSTHPGTAGLQWRMDRQSFCSGAIPPLLSRTHSGCPGPCRPAHLSNLARLRARWELLDSGFSKTPQDRIYSRNVACPCGVRLSLPRSFFLLIIQIQTGFS